MEVLPEEPPIVVSALIQESKLPGAFLEEGYRRNRARRAAQHVPTSDRNRNRHRKHPYRARQFERWARIQAEFLVTNIPELAFDDAIHLTRDDLKSYYDEPMLDVRFLDLPCKVTVNRAIETIRRRRAEQLQRQAAAERQALIDAAGPDLKVRTGEAALDEWRALPDNAGVPDSLGMSSMMLIDFAEDLEIGEWWFVEEDIAPARAVLAACTAALECVKRALDKAEAKSEVC